ncbi:hypothetical protein [Clostridium butyricum]
MKKLKTRFLIDMRQPTKQYQIQKWHWIRFICSKKISRIAKKKNIFR